MEPWVWRLKRDMRPRGAGGDCSRPRLPREAGAKSAHESRTIRRVSPLPEAPAPLPEEGLLSEHDLAEVIEELHRRRWSGQLTLSHQGSEVRITVKDGRLVFASSSNPDHRLGELLLRRGVVGLRALTDASGEVQPGKRLGTVLVEKGLLEPKELVRSVVDQTQENIYRVFQWTGGHFRLKQGSEAAESITLNISTPDLILEGIRRIEAWSRIKKGIGDLATCYVCCEGHEAVARQMQLTAEQRALLDALRRPASVEALCAGSPLRDFEVCQALWAFRAIGLVRRAPPAAAGVALLDDEGLGEVLGAEEPA